MPRINVTISDEAREQLVRMAGSERKMGAAIEAMIDQKLRQEWNEMADFINLVELCFEKMMGVWTNEGMHSRVAYRFELESGEDCFLVFAKTSGGQEIVVEWEYDDSKDFMTNAQNLIGRVIVHIVTDEADHE